MTSASKPTSLMLKNAALKDAANWVAIKLGWKNSWKW